MSASPTSQAPFYLDQQPLLRPRSQPLRVAPTTPATAVVRLELTKSAPAAFDDKYRARLARDIIYLATTVPARALQIDFDALASQHRFYRDLLQDVRRQLPSQMPLSTALGSWCAGDDWLRGLPIDEAVPMMFRMEPHRDASRNRWPTGTISANRFAAPASVSPPTNLGPSSDWGDAYTSSGLTLGMNPASPP